MTDERHWVERNQILVALLLFGGPFLLGMGLKEAGVSDGWADLTQIVIGVTALVVVARIFIRVRSEREG